MSSILLSTACASFPTPSLPGFGRTDRGRPVPRLREARPERAADYDVLVAEMAGAEGDLERARAAFERAAEKAPDSAFLHGRLARLAWQAEELDVAVAEAERAFELAPNDLEARLFLGRLYRLRQNFDGLDRVLRDAEGRPLDADSAAALFQVAIERGDLFEAERLANDLSEREPDQLRGVLGLATVYEQRGDFDRATGVVREALSEFPGNFVLYMRLVQIERQRGDKRGEVAVYREVLESHPNHYGILQQLGRTQLEVNDIEGAIATYRRVLVHYPQDVNTLRRLASIEFSAGRYESAAGRLEAVLATDPDQPELLFALGQIYRAAGKETQARRVFEAVAPAAPNYVDARVQLVALLEDQGDTAGALAEIDRIRPLRDDPQLDYHAAALRIEMGDFEAGVALLESLLDGGERDKDVYYQLGAQYGAKGDTEKALDYMQRVLELDAENANALNYVGYSWAERGENLEEAESLVRRAMELSPGDGYITDSLGWVYYKMAERLFADGRRDEALASLDRAQEQLLQAAELTGGDSVVSEHLGDVLLLRGDKRGALDYYEEAVTLEIREEEQPDLLEKLETLRRDLGRPAPR